MKVDDFRFMWRGKQLAPLTLEQSQLLSSIDKRNHHKEKALLLVHGFSSSPAVFRELLPHLTLYDAIVCPVLPGHGDSILQFSKTNAADWVQAAESACQSLTESYQAIDVMGLSLGGVLACHLSQQFSLHHLYLLAPALSLQVKIKPSILLARILHAFGFRHLRNRAGNLCKPDARELAYRQLPIPAIIEILTLIEAFKFIPPNCPVDLFLGRYDEVVHSQAVAELFADHPTTNTHWLENSAHVLPLDNDASTIVNCIKENWEKVQQPTEA